jgi:hypothetical protein
MLENLDVNHVSLHPLPAESQAVREWLPEFLSEHSIPLEKFGTGTHKSLNDLVDEIIAGEYQLDIDYQTGSLVRVGTIVRLDILYLPSNSCPLKLYEAEQRFCDGRTRTRPTEFAVWEKLKPGEHPDQGVVRALSEELKLVGLVTVQGGQRTEVIRKPDDYPRISSRFTSFDFVVHLSPETFCPDGYQEIQRQKTTFFKWRALMLPSSHSSLREQRAPGLQRIENILSIPALPSL